MNHLPAGRPFRSKLRYYAAPACMAAFLILAACDTELSSVSKEKNPAPLGTDKELLSFGFADPQSAGAIDQGNRTVSVMLPYGSARENLIAHFESSGAAVRVEGTAQVSGVTANDFSSPLTYTVAAEDGSTKNYLVSVSVAPSDSKAMTAFGILNPPAQGLIDEGAGTIQLTVPFGTDLQNLVALFSSTGTGVSVGGYFQESGTTPNDFTASITYTVHAGDGSSKDYLVTVSPAEPASEKAITAFSISGVGAGSIDEAAGRIFLAPPAGTGLAGRIASFSTTGVRVRIGAVEQISGSTSNNFTSTTTYTVDAQDGSSRSYSVVTLLPPSSCSAYVSTYASPYISWTDASAQESGYMVQRKVGVGGSWNDYAELPANTSSFKDLSQAVGQTYTYRVAAVHAAGRSLYSPEAVAVIPNPPAPPTNLRITGQEYTFINSFYPTFRVSFAWDDVANETGYRFMLRDAYPVDDSEQLYSGENVTTCQTWILTTGGSNTYLEELRWYYWKVRAWNSGGYADAEASFKTGLYSPMDFTVFCLWDNGSYFGRPEIRWTSHSTKASGYRIYRSYTGTGNWVLIATLGASARSFIDETSTATPGQMVYYDLEAYGPAGETTPRQRCSTSIASY